ncbi:hypothetical protein EW146_g1686 [Bondarzewia mesenterica]|uniref:Uncharacterized protein n=1 Tax=Bondarzewia mesenterica TaxID=1095465 RepID=A0A4S4M313_9AGAM|nr:hypothetical protein EW146_g1686 [Bondarzewia mesenterica]
MGKSLTKVVYKPDNNATDVFMIIVNPVEYKKWKEGDTTIPLVEVVDSFEVLHSGQGSQGLLGKPSKQELDTVFGTHVDTEVVTQILQKGKEEAGEGLSSTKWGSKNDSRGSGALDMKRAYYAAIEPTAYLHDLVAPTGGAVRSTPDTPARMALLQLANLYLLFALNERLVLSSTSSITTWKRMLFCLLVADFGHLLTMAPAGLEVFWKVWKWNAMMWGSIGLGHHGWWEFEEAEIGFGDMDEGLPCSVYNHLGVTFLSLISLYFVFNAIYQLVFSPLSAVPGPWHAAVSDFWLTTHVLRLQQCKTIHSLFDKYGPVVRVGPNKVVFNDLLTTKSVYTIHKFDKSTYYKSLLTNDNDHAMTTLPHSPHVARKRGYAPHYAPSNLASFQPEIHQYTLELVDILNRFAGGTSLDCLVLFRQLMVDILATSSFGFQLGALSKWDVKAQDPLAMAIGDFPKRGILRSAVPTWAWNLVCRFPNGRWRQLCDSDKIMAEFVSARVYETRSQMNAGKMGESEKTPMLQRLLQYRLGGSNELMSDQDVISEHMGHLIAGSDTTSTTLSYLCWELSRRSDIVKKLQLELDTAMADSTAIPDISVLQQLPYLNAFIKEGLRVYGAAPSLLERVVPSTTAKNGLLSDAFDLMGFALPPGTIVATQGWSMHRNPALFPSPDTFLPDRWLETEDNSDVLIDMAQHMMPFGVGARVCGGQNLAQIVLRIVVAALVRNFDVVAPEETTEKSMEMKDSFVIFPASMDCRMVFNARKGR